MHLAWGTAILESPFLDSVLHRNWARVVRGNCIRETSEVRHPYFFRLPSDPEGLQQLYSWIVSHPTFFQHNIATPTGLGKSRGRGCELKVATYDNLVRGVVEAGLLYLVR
jgi:hypothetical protein